LLVCLALLDRRSVIGAKGSSQPARRGKRPLRADGKRGTMSRILAVLMTASLTMAACDDGVVQSVSSPTATAQPTSPATDNTGFAIGGIVQSVEKPTREVSGALIEVTQGPNAGKSTVSDSTGSFAIFGLTAGPATIRVSRNGFQTWTSKDFNLQGDTKIAVEL